MTPPSRVPRDKPAGQAVEFTLGAPGPASGIYTGENEMRLDESGLQMMVATRHIPPWDPAYGGASRVHMPVRTGFPAFSGTGVWAGQEPTSARPTEPGLVQARPAPDMSGPSGIVQAVANAFGELILMGVGLVASLAVFVFVSPLWGIVTATALGSGYYLWRAYTEQEYKRLYNV